MTRSETSEQPPAPPPLAIKELSERCMGSADVAMLVLNMLEKQLRGDMPEIERLVAAQDAALVAKAAHALKGAAGAAAAPALHDLAAKIEMMAKGNQLALLSEIMVRLRAEVERCIGYLPAARESLRGCAGGEPLPKEQRP
ncbi:MAG: Hpt domain-containing protein [Phycisphaeraceae bacterium]|nr:Hpt domain-containing protein [Phycisphaeraceae bacterium]